MLVSVIIPIYNSSKFLEKLLNNVICQTYKDIEIILINDGSKDNSLQICKEFQQKDKRIKVISKENGGVSSARNKGIEMATGKYITFVDSDDNIDKNYINTLVNNIKENYLVKVNTKNTLKEEIISREKYIKGIVSGKIQGVCWGYLFEKELLNNIKFDVNTSYMEDTIFIMQYLFKVSKIKILKEKLYYHEVNEEGLTTSNKLEKKINGYIYSINEIEKILIDNRIEKNSYKKYIENRRIKLIEAEITKAKNIEEIQKMIHNKNVIEIMKIKKVNLKYKLFMQTLKTNNPQKILIYVKLRERIKKIVKGK